MATATLLVSAPLIMMPTAASAFDLGGLVHGTIARYAARYAGGGHYAGVHVVSHQSRHSDDDATPGSTNTPPPRDMAAVPHRVQDTDRMTPQVTDTVRVVSVGRSYSDEPSFAPSR